ncbi:hypothetical protein ABEF95_001858 [Exophiala dermatitidis]
MELKLVTTCIFLAIVTVAASRSGGVSVNNNNNNNNNNSPTGPGSGSWSVSGSNNFIKVLKIRHDGKAHVHPRWKQRSDSKAQGLEQLHPRQDGTGPSTMNSAVEGLGVLQNSEVGSAALSASSSSSGTLVSSVSSSTSSSSSVLSSRSSGSGNALTTPISTTSTTASILTQVSASASDSEPVFMIPSYQFPTTVLQIPVATICPPDSDSQTTSGPGSTSSSSLSWTLISLSPWPTSGPLSPDATNGSSSVVDNGTTNIDTTTTNAGATSGDKIGATAPSLIQLVNATAILPNGSTTVFLSTTTTTTTPRLSSSSSSSPLPTSSILAATAGTNSTTQEHPDSESDPDTASASARIIMDDQGCQTIYSALTTRYCSTTLPPPAVGVVPVVVSECDQWVTFSSETRRDMTCSTIGTVSASVASAPATAAAAASSSAGASASATGPSPTLSPTTGSELGLGMTFYAAHWYDLAQVQDQQSLKGAVVPSIVRVEECGPATTGTSNGSEVATGSTTTIMNVSGGADQDQTLNCLTSTESWQLITSTTTRIGISVASFSGTAIITSAHSYIATTTLSFESTVTTTSVGTVTSIVRSRLAAPSDSALSLADDDSEEGEETETTTIGEERTVTVAVTMPTSTRTVYLESIQGQTVTVTVRMTDTVQVTETRTRTSAGTTSVDTGSGTEIGPSAGSVAVTSGFVA